MSLGETDGVEKGNITQAKGKISGKTRQAPNRGPAAVRQLSGGRDLVDPIKIYKYLTNLRAPGRAP